MSARWWLSRRPLRPPRPRMHFFFWFFKCSIMAPKSLCSKPARPARPRRKRGATMLIVMAIALTIALTHGSDPPKDATQRVYLTARAQSCEARSHNQLTQKPVPASPRTANNLCPHNMSPTIRTPTYDTHHTIPQMCQSRTAHTILLHTPRSPMMRGPVSAASHRSNMAFLSTRTPTPPGRGPVIDNR